METDNGRSEGNAGGLFIPAGVISGMGFGFIFDNIPASMFIGLGLGFAAFAITLLITGRPRSMRM